MSEFYEAESSAVKQAVLQAERLLGEAGVGIYALSTVAYVAVYDETKKHLDEGYYVGRTVMPGTETFVYHFGIGLGKMGWTGITWDHDGDEFRPFHATADGKHTQVVNGQGFVDDLRNKMPHAVGYDPRRQVIIHTLFGSRDKVVKKNVISKLAVKIGW